MKSFSTKGIICVNDKYGFQYHVSKIEYTVYEDGQYTYTFIPNYNVIDLLDIDLFQGIPGIDLDLQKDIYVRENRVPVFISERSPNKNRENLWELLEEQKMRYLNQLEWLIRTDSIYSGDSLYVIKDENQDEEMEIENVSHMVKNAQSMMKQVISNICKAGRLTLYGRLLSEDENALIFHVLMNIYIKQNRYVLRQQKKGMNKKKNSDVDDTRLYEVVKKYKAKQITINEALAILQISRATFYRRIKNISIEESGVIKKQ